MSRGLFVIAPTVVVGVVAGLVTIAAHQSDPAFIFQQQHPAAIEPSQLETIVKMTREPVPGKRGSAAVAVRCIPGRRGTKHNPWVCMVRYGSGHVIRYHVTIQLSGRFQGADRTGTRVIGGCCVEGGATAPK